MSNPGFVLITLCAGVLSLVFSFWWTSWIFCNNPLITSQKKRWNQRVLTFFLLVSCWFLAFAITQEDLGYWPSSEGRADLVWSSLGVVAVVMFLFLLLWDCFCCGEPPHLIPTRSAVVAIVGTSAFLMPGLALLAVYQNENGVLNESISDEYVPRLLNKGIGLAVTGSAIDIVAICNWGREKTRCFEEAARMSNAELVR